MKRLPLHIETEVQRILDSAARRILTERQRKTLNTPTGGDSDLGNQANDQGTALVKRERIPVGIRVKRETGKAVA